MSGATRSACGLAIVLLLAVACGSDPDGSAQGVDVPDVDAVDVRRCLVDALGTDGWAEIPLSDTGTVYGVDFGPNSVQLYIEPDASTVSDKVDSIREAEDEMGNTAPEDRLILSERGNVLLAWANQPTADQRDQVERCVGFS